MKFYIPFGDWSHDGHGMCENVLVEAESMDKLYKAVDKIKEKYGKDFFYYFANECENPVLSTTIIQALVDTGYSLDDFLKTGGLDEYDPDHDINFDEDGIKTFKDLAVFEKWIPDGRTLQGALFNLETIEHMYIHLLNAFGAEITVCKGYPYFDYETVGYGCFYH